MFPPQLYYRLQRSELVDAVKLDAVLKQAYHKFYEMRAREAKRPTTSDKESAKPISSFRPDVSFEGDELAEFFFSPPSAEVLDDFERFFLEDLRAIKALNSWQASQLAVGHCRFRLGDYRIVKQLGQGGYGQVFLGRPRSNPSNRARAVFSDDVAIKVLPLKSATPKATAKFLREIEISRLLQHSNIIRFLGASKDASVHFAVYEYCDGGDARRLLTKLKRLNYRVAAYIVFEAAKALASLHSQGLVHRDVKPANILLTKTGEVKLGDFGFVSPTANFSPDSYYSSVGAAILKLEEQLVEEVFQGDDFDGEAKKTFRRQIQGTPDYLAPDQLKNPEEPSPLWDIYSLGCALYYFLTGVVPFPSDNSREKMLAHFHQSPPNPAAVDPLIPLELSRLTMKMMAKEPENRIASAQEVVEALKPYVPDAVIDELEVQANVDTSSLRRRKNEESFWSDENLQRRFGYENVPDSAEIASAGNGVDSDSEAVAISNSDNPSPDAVSNAEGVVEANFRDKRGARRRSLFKLGGMSIFASSAKTANRFDRKSAALPPGLKRNRLLLGTPPVATTLDFRKIILERSNEIVERTRKIVVATSRFENATHWTIRLVLVPALVALTALATVQIVLLLLRQLVFFK